jgi:hypothetical protein
MVAPEGILKTRPAVAVREHEQRIPARPEAPVPRRFGPEEAVDLRRGLLVGLEQDLVDFRRNAAGSGWARTTAAASTSHPAAPLHCILRNIIQ